MTFDIDVVGKKEGHCNQNKVVWMAVGRLQRVDALKGRLDKDMRFSASLWGPTSNFS
jgi:hypothetical protein